MAAQELAFAKIMVFNPRPAQNETCPMCHSSDMTVYDYLLPETTVVFMKCNCCLTFFAHWISDYFFFAPCATFADSAIYGNTVVEEIELTGYGVLTFPLQNCPWCGSANTVWREANVLPRYNSFTAKCLDCKEVIVGLGGTGGTYSLFGVKIGAEWDDFIKEKLQKQKIKE